MSYSSGLDRLTAQAAQHGGDMLMQIIMGCGEKLGQCVAFVADKTGSALGVAASSVGNGGWNITTDWIRGSGNGTEITPALAKGQEAAPALAQVGERVVSAPSVYDCSMGDLGQFSPPACFGGGIQGGGISV